MTPFSTQKKWRGLFFEISATFQAYFGATIPVISLQRQGSKPPNFAIFYVFSYIKNMLKKSAFKNKRMTVRQLAFRARKFLASFEVRLMEGIGGFSGTLTAT